MVAAALLVAAGANARAQGQNRDAETPGDRAGAAGGAAEAGSGFDLSALQGILAIQQLDGWLLYDYQGQNPIARELVAPRGRPSRRWFYLIPAEGQPVALVQRVDADSFEHVPGRKVVYTTYRELERGLAAMLDGRKRIAMEYSPRAELPSLSRVDAGTLEMVRSRKVKIRSSAELVQFAKSLWGPGGRTSHYVAAHHLEELRKDALEFVARRLRKDHAVTERDVQLVLMRGFRIRGLIGPPPIVASGKNTANPQYLPSAGASATIERGDLVLIDMWARVKSDKREIVANTTWMAYAGDSVPASYADAFAVVVRARDAALGLIEDRLRRRRAIRGFEVDRAARQVVAEAGFGDKFLHRTGHSIDTDAHGAGANLDDYETRDTRSLVVGSGFSISPGIYLPGEYGVRAEINVYLGPGGVEVTTPRQTEITALLARD